MYVPFSINGAFTDVTITHEVMGTNAPHTNMPSQMLALELCLIISWIVFFLFSPKDTMDMTSKKQSEMWTLATEHT